MADDPEARMAEFRAAIERARGGHRQSLYDCAVTHADLIELLAQYRADGDAFGEETTLEMLEAREAFINSFPGSSIVRPGERIALDPARLPPTTPFDGYLKQIRGDTLDPLQRFAVNIGFPLFLGAHQSTRPGQGEGGGGRDFCRRRFSGDTHATFPRARYHAVCMDQAGDDNGTLISEMNAYALPHLTGACVAGRSLTHDSVCLNFRGLPGEPNPLHLAATDPGFIERLIDGNAVSATALMQSRAELGGIPSAEQNGRLYVDCIVTHQSIANVVDLRRIEAREWLTELFHNPPDDQLGAGLRATAEANGVDPATLGDWWNLASLLCARTLGGNVFTDWVGTYLRTAGVDALIFPSARHDYFAHWDNGRLVQFSGWNMVDYRDCETPFKYQPQLTTVEGLSAIKVMHIEDGAERGTIGFMGNMSANKDVNDEHLVYFIASHGLNAMRNNGGNLSLQGFRWYKRRYSMLDSGFSAECGQCAFEFSDPAIGNRQSCPRCRYPGDYF